MQTTRELAPRKVELTAVTRQARRRGNALGNARLTSVVGVVLLLLLAAEGATIPLLGQLLSVHIFLGMLLLGPVALKLASTGYRFVRYYTHEADYVSHGPPAPLMRLLVAPVLVLSTMVLFGTGVLLLAVPHRGPVLGLHKASFIVWFGATSVHVLAYASRAARHLLSDVAARRPAGLLLRWAAVGIAVAAGVAIAVATYPLAGPWLHHDVFR